LMMNSLSSYGVRSLYMAPYQRWLAGEGVWMALEVS